MSSGVHAGAAVSSQHAPAVEVLAAAFQADPVYRQLVPDPRRRALALAALFRAAVTDASRHGAVDVATAGTGVVGAALWLAPGGFPMGTARKVRSVPGLLALLRAAPGSFVALARLGSAVEAAQPPEPSWYLQALGVHPGAHGQGIGGRLLAHGLERADRDRVPATLETAVPAAAALYERFGFRTTRRDVQLVAGGPRHQLMRRPPATAPPP